MLLLFIFTQDAHQLEEPTHGGNVTGKGIFFGFMVLCICLLALWVAKALAKEFKDACKLADQELTEINR